MAKTTKKKYTDPEKVSEFLLGFNSGPIEVRRGGPDSTPVTYGPAPKKRYPANMKKPGTKAPKK